MAVAAAADRYWPSWTEGSSKRRAPRAAARAARPCDDAIAEAGETGDGVLRRGSGERVRGACAGRGGGRAARALRSGGSLTSGAAAPVEVELLSCVLVLLLRCPA